MIIDKEIKDREMELISLKIIREESLLRGTKGCGKRIDIDSITYTCCSDCTHYCVDCGNKAGSYMLLFSVL